MALLARWDTDRRAELSPRYLLYVQVFVSRTKGMCPHRHNILQGRNAAMAKGNTIAASVGKLGKSYKNALVADSHLSTAANTNTTPRKSKRHENPSVSDAASQVTKRRRPEYNLSHSPSKRTRRLANYRSVQSKPWEENLRKTSGGRVRTVESKAQAHIVRDGSGEDDFVSGVDQGSAHLDLVDEGSQKCGIEVSPVTFRGDRHTESSRIDQIDHDKSPLIDEDETISGRRISRSQQRWQIHGRAPETGDSLRFETEEDAGTGTNNAQKTKVRRHWKDQNASVEMDPKYWIRRQIYPVLEILVSPDPADRYPASPSRSEHALTVLIFVLIMRKKVSSNPVFVGGPSGGRKQYTVRPK